MIFPVSKPSSMCWVRFDTWAVQYLPGAEASLLWYKDMIDNGRQAVKYQAQFVEVTQTGNWSEAFRARWVLSWFKKGNNTCLSRVTCMRCVLVHVGRIM